MFGGMSAGGYAHQTDGNDDEIKKVAHHDLLIFIVSFNRIDNSYPGQELNESN